MNKSVGAIVVCVALRVLPVGAQAVDSKVDPWRTPVAGEYVYTAETATRARQQGEVIAGGIRWKCQESVCQTRGPWPSPGVASCKALAERVGQIRSYGRPGNQLDASALQRCNEGIPPAITFMDVQKPHSDQVYQKGQTVPAPSPHTSPRIDPRVLTRVPAADSLVRFGKIALLPTGPRPPPVTGIRALGPLRSLGSLEMRTLQNQLYQGSGSNDYYYLPRAIRLFRDPATGYRLTALPTGEDEVRLSLVLKADQDPAEVALMERLVKEEKGSTARLLPLPYDDAEIRGLEALEDWEIEPVRIPSFGSLDSEIPLNLSMPTDSFADLKAILENVGLGGGFVLKTGEQEHEVNIQISLLLPTGPPYSPLPEVTLGYEPQSNHLVLGNVRNLSAFPMTVDGVDLETRFPGWSEPELFSDLRVDPPVRIEPGDRAVLRARVDPSSRLHQGLTALGLSSTTATVERARPGDRDSTDILRSLELLVKILPIDRQIRALGITRDYARDGSLDDTDRRWLVDAARDVLDHPDLGSKERVMIEDLIDELEGHEAETVEPERTAAPVASVPALQEATLRYALRNTPDASCQPCLNAIWDRLEVVGYLERRQQLQVEAMPAVFSESYGPDTRVEVVNVDLKSPLFSASSRGDVEVPRSLVLTEDHISEQLEIFLPADSSQVLSFQYRLEAITEDGSRFRGDWMTREDSLTLLITSADVRTVVGRAD